MNQPVQLKQPNGTANGSGTSYSRGKVLGVDGLIAHVQLPTGEVIQVRTDFLRGKSGPPLAGEIWILDQLYGQWLFAVPVGIPGTAAGAGALAGLSDVAITSPANGESLVYNAATSKWKNQLASAASASNPFTGVAERALSFLKWQMLPSTGVSQASDSTVVLSRRYPYTYTGTIVGYFDPGQYNNMGFLTTPVYQAQLVLNTLSGVSIAVATSTISADGSFTFGSAARNGYKSVKIIDTANFNQVVADSTHAPGTIRSIMAPYSGAAGQVSGGLTGYSDTVSYSYDQGMALMAAVAMGDLDFARQLYQGLMRKYIPTGTNVRTWPVMTEQLTPMNISNVFRLNDHFMALMGLVTFAGAAGFDEVFGGGAPNLSSGFPAPFPKNGTTGLYLNGSGTYPTNGVGYALIGSDQSASAYGSEGNLLAWLAFTKTRHLIQAGPIGTASDLQQAIMTRLWNSSANRFNRDATNTTADTLRARIYGYFFLRGIGRTDIAPNLITDTALTPFKHTSTYSGAKGYSAYYHSTDYTATSYPIWAEGTLLLALAFLVSGDIARWSQTLSQLFVLSPGLDNQIESGGGTANEAQYMVEVQRIQSSMGGIPYLVGETADYVFPAAANLYWSVSSASAAILAICGAGIFGV